MSRPRPLSLHLVVAVVALQALVLVVVAVLDLADLGGADGLGVAAAIFFLICAGALGLCDAGLFGLQSWARAPIVIAQIIELGLAWDARHDTAALAVALAVLAVLGLGGLLHPATTRALAPEDYPGDR